MAAAVLTACGSSSFEEDSALATATSALSGFTSPTKSSHQYPNMVLLADGRALVADQSSETFDPATGLWSLTGPLNEPRYFAALVRLDDGRVLASGGMNRASAEIFDPQTNAWTPTASMTVPRDRPRAVKLADGRVLMVGGLNVYSPAELFDPVTGTWTQTAQPSYQLDGPGTLLPDGRALFVTYSKPELYDPNTGSFSQLNVTDAGRLYHTEVLLDSGKVLLAGGTNATSQLFDPATNTFSLTGAMTHPKRWHAASAKLSDGTVIVAGGYNEAGATLGSIERYDPSTGTWSDAGNLLRSREYSVAAQLGNGEVLVVGGGYRQDSAVVTINPSQVAELVSTGSCVPQTCGGLGAACGAVADGCGGTLECGGCAPGSTCQPNNTCQADCVPTTCESQGRGCGTTSDGCGTTLQCGSCASGEICTAAGACVLSPGMASYDSTHQVPGCIGEQNSCDSGALLTGRAQLGPEANAPNTLDDSCADGIGGSFHGDESLDRLKVSSVNGGPLRSGQRARVEATVWAFSGYGSDKLDLYSTADLANRNWVLIGTLTPGRAGAQVLSAEYTLPFGSQQAIRGVFRYGGSAGPCVSGPFNDHDDLSFNVIVPEDTAPPTVAITAPAPAVTVSGMVTLMANASDDVGVARVEFYIRPNRVGSSDSLIGSDASAPFSVVWNTTQAPAASSYVLTARAFDFSGKSSTSAPQVQVVDNTPPEVKITTPTDGATVSGIVTVQATASDYSGVKNVRYAISGKYLGAPTASPYTVSFGTEGLAAGPHPLTATATDWKGNTRTVSITLWIATPGSSTAVYSSSWGAPACSAIGATCDSGTLLNGRAQLGPEVNAPNTLSGSSCMDGTSGAYHQDESIDRVVIQSMDSGPLRVGAQARVSATVWAFNGTDVLDVYVAASASFPTWTWVGSVNAAGSGAQTLSVTYTLPTGSMQAVRTVFRYGGSPLPCPTGSFDDKDDLVFAVQ